MPETNGVTAEKKGEAEKFSPAGDGPDSAPDLPGMGLLTDTGETEENRVDNPQAAMVKAVSRPTRVAPTAKKRRVLAPALPGEEGGYASGDLPFSILLETFDNPENAKKGVALYAARGIEAHAVKVDLDPAGIKYRLFCGTFASDQTAKAFIAAHSLSGKLVKHTPFTAVLGSFADQTVLREVIDKATAIGTFPYVLGAEAGAGPVVVGAFYTRDGAERQCRELTAAGLPCVVARRSTTPR